MADIYNIRIKDTIPKAIMLDKYVIGAGSYKYDFNEWILNPNNSDGIVVTNNKIVINKFKPNLWFIRSNTNSSPNTDTTGICEFSKNFTAKLEGFTDELNINLFNNNYAHHSVVGGSGATVGEIRGLYVGPGSFSLPSWIGNTYINGIDRVELPFSAYVWDNMTYTNGSTVQLASETTALRGQAFSAGYNMYGRNINGDIKFLPDWKSFPVPYTNWEICMGLFTGYFTFKGWTNFDSNNPAIMKFSTRINAKYGDNLTEINYNFGSITIKVEGLLDGDRLEFGKGVIEESANSIKTDGIYTVGCGNSINVTMGFKLYGNELKSDVVTVTILNRNNKLDSNGYVDISSNPITITLPNDNGIDPGSIEAWKIAKGNNIVYDKTKTINNYLIKYGIAYRGRFLDVNDNVIDNDHLFITGKGVDSAITDLYISPVKGLFDYIDETNNADSDRVSFNVTCKNNSFWDKVKEYYAKAIINSSKTNLFQFSNINGKLVLNFGDNVQFFHDCFMGTSLEEIELNLSKDLNSGHNLFRRVYPLKKVVINNHYISGRDLSGFAEMCYKLTTFPYDKIKWTDNKYTGVNFPQPIINYAFNSSGVTKIISNDNENKYIQPTLATQAFFSGTITEIGLIIDCQFLDPADASYMFGDNITVAHIYNLRKGNWTFTKGVSAAGAWIAGDLSKLNSDCIKELINNLYDCTTDGDEIHSLTVPNSWKTILETMDTKTWTSKGWTIQYA